MDTISSGLNAYVDQISRVGGELAPMVAKGMILLLIVLFLVKYLGKVVAKILIKYGMPERKAAYSLTGLHILVLLVGALVVLNMVGFPGALLFRIIMVIVMVSMAAYIIAKPYIPRLPFKKGNIIQIGDSFGIVDMISVMYTRIRTFEGKVIYIPNHKVLNDQVTNSSERPNRRLDIDFFIPYDQDLDKVKEVVGKILEEDEIVLEKPVPRVVIDRFSPNYMEMKARFWVERKHALTGRWGLNAKIKESFDREGIRMASPRLEITRNR
ncbi:MAG: mechanosensitive ion channel [Deltaproteobacteria bacterium]|nr:mechanosensitive ion channel [Deltaproteobacteria bacterium]MBW2047124.1 mechanosensitive ion channel [Deltaproteobacteria bacterium]MBW2109929.1 mechanosensitive ion channel [Deltaproteobacteria bacterium]MBW2351848.1 mechanosensitive ion channel [Deltaproteobacteria bacterium]HDZ90767.1 mechanosensitive ion channel [Deltaproteobacteria bacterium]